MNSAGGNGAATPLMQRLSNIHARLSPGRQQLVDGILANLDQTVFESAREIAGRLKTDQATVSRTVKALGYAQYSDFERDLRDHYRSRFNPNPYQLRTPYGALAAEASDQRDPAHHVGASIARDLQSVQWLQNTLDPAAVAALGRHLQRCRNIVVVAGDLEHTLGEFLAYGLSALGMTAVAPHGEGLTLHHQRALTKADGCIGLAFRRCLRVPVEAMRVARRRGAFTLAITDAQTSALARQAQHALLVPIEGESFASSYVATMTAINALLVACSHADAKRSLKFLKPTEEEFRCGARWYQELPRKRGKANGSRRERTS